MFRFSLALCVSKITTFFDHIDTTALLLVYGIHDRGHVLTRTLNALNLKQYLDHLPGLQLFRSKVRLPLKTGISKAQKVHVHKDLTSRRRECTGIVGYRISDGVECSVMLVYVQYK